MPVKPSSATRQTTPNRNHDTRWTVQNTLWILRSSCSWRPSSRTGGMLMSSIIGSSSKASSRFRTVRAATRFRR
ncbi:transposase [Paracoccus sp. NBH48]|nr:transposase [Paracoccus sp. NBH48]